MPEATPEPAIKGVVLELLLEAVRKQLREHELDRVEVERTIGPEELRLLEERAVAGLWYPMRTFARLLEISIEGAGHNERPEELIRSGIRAARRLSESDVYAKFAATAEAARSREHAGRMLVGLAPLILNFSRWTYDPGPKDGSTFTIEGREAGPVPDALVALGRGFIQHFAELVNGCPVRIISDRPTRDRIVFRGVRGR